MLTLNACLWGRLVEILLTSKIRQIRHPFTWVQIRIVHLSENLPEKVSIKGGSFSALPNINSENRHRKGLLTGGPSFSKQSRTVIVWSIIPYAIRTSGLSKALWPGPTTYNLIPMVHLVQKVDSKYKKKLP